MNYWKELLSRACEDGQAIIFVAILAPVMLLTLGLAVEGGQVFWEYRHLQAAADMGALIGAQELPCGVGACSTQTNRAYWCAYANYYGMNDDNTTSRIPGNASATCTTSTAQTSVGGPVAVTASVPPVSCSPYDAIDYGNASLNNQCKQNGATQSEYAYIEVQVQHQMTVPIFNVTFNLSAHAVARKGQPSPKDFALTVLNPSLRGALSLGGSASNGIVIVGSTVVDSMDASAITHPGSAHEIACDGAWFTSSPTETDPGFYSATDHAIPAFAPPSCNNAPSTCSSPPCYDSPDQWRPNWPYVADPYCSSWSPPTITSTDCRGTSKTASMTNCGPCTATGQVYTWSTTRMSGSWTSASSLGVISGAGSYEFFPGIYPNGIKITLNAGKVGNVYFNPGVYTLKGDLTVTGQANICMYGSPECDNQLGSIVNPANTLLNCSTADFGNSNVPGPTSYTVTSGTWYYYCSPWGVWDTTALPLRTVSTTPPTFTDTTTPLNGITFVLTNHANFKMAGGGAAQLAFPNPCPGTAAKSGSSVPFFDPANSGLPNGTNDATGYTYPGSSLASLDGKVSSGKSVYPNADLSILGECPATGSNKNAGGEWTGEFGQSGSGTDLVQHLHFLVYARDGQSLIQITGGSGQNVWGIVYNPGDPTAYKVSGCNNPNKCAVTLTGSSGSAGTHGPPMMIGQVIADNFGYGGSASPQLFYRPCTPDSICSSGAGSGLVQ